MLRAIDDGAAPLVPSAGIKPRSFITVERMFAVQSTNPVGGENLVSMLRAHTPPP